jgi:hypothetical protein
MERKVRQLEHDSTQTIYFPFTESAVVEFTSQAQRTLRSMRMRTDPTEKSEV